MGHAHPDDQALGIGKLEPHMGSLPHWLSPVSQRLSVDVQATARRWATSRRTAAMSRGASPSGRGVSVKW